MNDKAQALNINAKRVGLKMGSMTSTGLLSIKATE
jgi:hypothetical protein